MTELEAKDILRGMTFEECMKMWNESAKDYTDRRKTDDFECSYEIHEVDDEGWWHFMANELSGFWFMRNILDSGETFNNTDKFVFYDAEAHIFVSFSTKQEFIEAVGEDFFINEIVNRN